MTILLCNSVTSWTVILLWVVAQWQQTKNFYPDEWVVYERLALSDQPKRSYRSATSGWIDFAYFVGTSQRLLLIISFWHVISAWVCSEAVITSRLGDLICLLSCIRFSCTSWLLFVGRQVLGARVSISVAMVTQINEALEDVVSKYASNKVTPHIDISHSPSHPITYLWQITIGYNVDWHWQPWMG